MWSKLTYCDGLYTWGFADLSCRHGIRQDNQMRRLLQSLSNLHGATILGGKVYWAYNLSPMIVTFSENRCLAA